jgi:hypothetical protein
MNSAGETAEAAPVQNEASVALPELSISETALPETVTASAVVVNENISEARTTAGTSDGVIPTEDITSASMPQTAAQEAPAQPELVVPSAGSTTEAPPVPAKRYTIDELRAASRRKKEKREARLLEIVEMVREKGTITRDDIVARYGVSPQAARAYTKTLLKRKVLKKKVEVRYMVRDAADADGGNATDTPKNPGHGAGRNM